MKRILVFTILMVALAAVVGCAAPAPAPAAATAAPQPTTEAAAPTTQAAAPTAASGTRSYTDIFGTVEIPANPQRIVAADMGVFIATFGALAAVDAKPVVVTIDQIPPYLESYTEGVQVLPGTAINYEAIAAANPDLIITPGVEYNKENYDLLSKIAPTVAPKWGWQTLEENRSYALEVAKLVNKEAEMQALIAKQDARIAELEAKYAESLKGKPISVLQIQGADMQNVYLQRGRLESALLDAIGAERPANQEFDPTDSEWYVTLSPELLSEADGWMIFVELYSDKPEDIPAMQAKLEANPLWQQLDAVKNKRVYFVKTNEWSGTDPFIADIILDTLDRDLAAALATEGITPPSGTTSSSDVPRTVKHISGETTITGDAKRVIALEWTYVEHLLALGIQPVGVSDIEGFKQWVKTPGYELGPDVVDVGLRGEANMETILSLKPDLILEIDYNAPTTYEKLSAIAPTLVFSPYPDDPALSTFKDMTDSLLLIADATGTRAEGEAALKRMEQKFADSKAKLEAAGKGNAKFILSQAWGAGGDVGIRLFTDNGQATEVVKKLGLQNAWVDKEFQPYGFSTVTPESLASIPADTNFFYVVQDDDNPFTSTALKPLWDSLPFVQAGGAQPIGGDTWLFGGPISMELLADKITAALTEE